VIFCGAPWAPPGAGCWGRSCAPSGCPEYLHNLASLAAVLGIFIAANQIVHESGLLAVTVMGMAGQHARVDVRQILHFKKTSACC
jgi:NhaP-type Na+/H+ or K+/H+ antiporter